MTFRRVIGASLLVTGGFLMTTGGGDEDRANVEDGPVIEVLSVPEIQASDRRPDLTCQVGAWFEGATMAPFDPGC